MKSKKKTCKSPGSIQYGHTHIDAIRMDTIAVLKMWKFFFLSLCLSANQTKKKLRPAYTMWKYTNNSNMETHQFVEWLIQITQQSSMEFTVPPSVTVFANVLPTWNLFTCERAADWNGGEKKTHELKWQLMRCVENLLICSQFFEKDLKIFCSKI